MAPTCEYDGGLYTKSMKSSRVRDPIEAAHERRLVVFAEARALGGLEHAAEFRRRQLARPVAVQRREERRELARVPPRPAADLGAQLEREREDVVRGPHAQHPVLVEVLVLALRVEHVRHGLVAERHEALVVHVVVPPAAAPAPAARGRAVVGVLAVPGERAHLALGDEEAHGGDAADEVLARDPPSG
jgi:hypothetical protein